MMSSMPQMACKGSHRDQHSAPHHMRYQGSAIPSLKSLYIRSRSDTKRDLASLRKTKLNSEDAANLRSDAGVILQITGGPFIQHLVPRDVLVGTLEICQSIVSQVSWLILFSVLKLHDIAITWNKQI
jgi:hypothetical protein